MRIEQVRSTPNSCADDLATVCLSRTRIDRVLRLVRDYSEGWRFDFNAQKSANLVYGEDKRVNARNAADRFFMLGHERVKVLRHY